MGYRLRTLPILLSRDIYIDGMDVRVLSFSYVLQLHETPFSGSCLSRRPVSNAGSFQRVFDSWPGSPPLTLNHVYLASVSAVSSLVDSGSKTY